MAALDEPMTFDDGVLPLSATVGLAITRDPDATVDSLLGEADRDMYGAKVASGYVPGPAVRSRQELPR